MNCVWATAALREGDILKLCQTIHMSFICCDKKNIEILRRENILIFSRISAEVGFRKQIKFVEENFGLLVLERDAMLL